MKNLQRHSADAFDAQDPGKAVDRALEIIEAGRLPSIFLETDNGGIPGEVNDLLKEIPGLHWNVGSGSGDTRRGVLSEIRELTPYCYIDEVKQDPRGRDVITRNRKRIEEALSIFSSLTGGKIVVDETTEQHRIWLDTVIEQGERKRRKAAGA